MHTDNRLKFRSQSSRPILMLLHQKEEYVHTITQAGKTNCSLKTAAAGMGPCHKTGNQQALLLHCTVKNLLLWLRQF